MIYDINNFPYKIIENAKLVKKPAGNRGGKYKKLYKELVCAFDIETTRITEIDQSVMYVWQFQVDEYCTVIGRTWDEFTEFLLRCAELLDREEYLVIYVHNLSYEFQFISGIYNFLPDEVFAVERRKVLKCTMYNHFEFRCSYLHSNMSLDRFLKNMDVTHKKINGDDFNYDKKRYYWTELTELEIKYITHDVIGLVEAIKTELEKDNDTLYTIPLTSTGYVRRDVKEAMRKTSHDYIQSIYPDYDLYKMLREAFRGGDTHANRYFAGKLLQNVKSADRSSSYPETQCNSEYPVTKFIKADIAKKEDVDRKIFIRKKAVCMRIKLKNVRLQNEFWGDPYLSRDKCRNVIGGVFDNGRILSAEHLETTITDVDYRIINEEYIFDDFECLTFYQANYGMLPKSLTDTVKYYYRRKTALKGVDGEEYYYMKSKNKLNAIYGMTAQDPVKESIIYENNEFSIATDPEDELLSVNKRRAFIPYQWGVWCTALARYELYQGVKLAHGENAFFVYCDTDSVKYIGDIDWTEYNNNKIKLSTKNGAYAIDSKGTYHYMGVYEQEETYNYFKTYGAKKYAYEYEDGETHITIAGVPKKAGAKELQMAGGIKRFYPPFIFKAGKMESVYNDSAYGTYNVDGKNVYITKNVCLRPTTYELSLTNEYIELLDNVKNYEKCLTTLHKSGIL